ncbi:hypothetical protein BES34_007565 [Leptospira inadai serovar Lyme]|uniref:Uncharacterized protein n=1 Tax=Leptospira inadai serovar Lyme TaxID=293084 RepID=A0ABX4YJM6_9LEPT|nr:hypothetical protein BES34_007565 [Leptospira inadai serovar Lyme]
MIFINGEAAIFCGGSFYPISSIFEYHLFNIYLDGKYRFNFGKIFRFGSFHLILGIARNYSTIFQSLPFGSVEFFGADGFSFLPFLSGTLHGLKNTIMKIRSVFPLRLGFSALPLKSE